MKAIKLIQIGDIHYPDHKGSVFGDIKDDGAPAGLVAAMAPPKLPTVMKRITDVARRESVDGVLLCGDLTSRGDLAQYEECVTYVQKALDLANPSSWQPDAVHVVPGNHDVNRLHCDPDGKDLKVKFDPLIQPWRKIGLPILPIDGIRATPLELAGRALRLVSINSCMGCGERRHLPESIRDDLEAVLSRYSVTADPTAAFALLGEQLDTPAFTHRDVDDLIADISALENTCLPIVLAHHNLLPQALLRVDLYTELLNSGLTRSRLTSCNRPVIYCHGHVHADPVEQIVDQRHPLGKVTAISAPELVEGFNLLAIYFATNDIPIGCEIMEYRTKSHGGVDLKDTIRVPLVGSEGASQCANDDLRHFVRITTGERQRFDDLWNKFKSDIRTVYRQTIRDLLVEAEWLSLVEIDDRDLPFQNWKIRRVEL